MSAASKPTWWVVCTDHQVGPCPTLATAERRRDEIAKLGACTLPHEIEERAA